MTRSESEGRKFLKSSLFLELLMVAVLILIGSVVFTFAENLRYFDALYFTITTMATIGLGDIVPHTVLGKVFVTIYALLGVPLFVSVSGLIFESRFNRRIKTYVTHFYKELHTAETEIKDMEAEVSQELSEVIKQNAKQGKATHQEVEETKEEVTEIKDITTKTKNKVEKIEKVVKESPRWKKKIW